MIQFFRKESIVSRFLTFRDTVGYKYDEPIRIDFICYLNNIWLKSWFLIKKRNIFDGKSATLRASRKQIKRMEVINRPKIDGIGGLSR